MISADTPLVIHAKAQEGFIEFLKAARTAQSRVHNMREYFRTLDLAYYREQDLTTEQARAKIANKYGDSTKFQNITVPIVMPQVEAAVTYQASVFLSGTPLFPVVAEPANMDAALQLETIIDNQAIRGGWVHEFMLLFRDAYKYNFGALEVDWIRDTTPSLETDVKFSTKEAKPNQVIWEGNAIKRIDPYNLIYDTRVPPTQVHTRGEYVGYTQIMSRMELKAFLASLDGKIIANVKSALESGLGNTTISSSSETASYYIPQVNPDISISKDQGYDAGDFNWIKWAAISGADGGAIQYKNAYQITTLYARILPEDFGLKVPNRNTPQVWKFIYVNDSVLILAERQTNAHNYLPIMCVQGTVDGLGHQTKSLASNGVPLQQLSSAIWNAIIAGTRRSITDRVLYDPSRVSKELINSANPSAKIPVRPAAYGKPVGESVYQFPFRMDNIADLSALSNQVNNMADKLDRQNPIKRGEFVKGNKLKAEVDAVMSNASGGDQMRAMQLEATLFTPLKEILKLNILQYQGAEAVFSRDKDQLVTVDPIALRKAVMAFKVSDGLVPSEQLISESAIRDGFQTLANMPQLAAGYNLPPFFSYMMKLQGAKISAFEKPREQVAYEQAVSQWQQLVLQMVKENPAITQQQFPPQPTPQEFGYNPGEVENESAADKEPIQQSLPFG